MAKKTTKSAPITITTTTVTVNSNDAAVAARWMVNSAKNLRRCALDPQVIATRGADGAAKLILEAEALDRVAKQLYPTL